MLVEELFNIEYPNLDKKWNLAALLHDAPEYVIGDLIHHLNMLSITVIDMLKII